MRCPIHGVEVARSDQPGAVSTMPGTGDPFRGDDGRFHVHRESYALSPYTCPKGCLLTVSIRPERCPADECEFNAATVSVCYTTMEYLG